MEEGSHERILSHLAFARAVARRSLSPKCSPEDREDLLAWGVVGLVQAARRYREGGRASFALAPPPTSARPGDARLHSAGSRDR